MGLTVPRKEQDSEAVTEREMTPGFGLVSTSYRDPFDLPIKAWSRRNFRRSRVLSDRTPSRLENSLRLAVSLIESRVQLDHSDQSAPLSYN